MQQPLSNILVKVFARGFYKVNSGLLIFLFVILVSYCFFINTLGDVKLLPPGKELYYQFMILITFVSSPGMMLMFFTIWIFYTIKSWQYVSSQLQIEDHEFLYYSILSASKGKQFKGWLYMQFIISLPFAGYALLASIIGVVLHHYAMVMIIILFITLLINITAFIYTKQLNTLIKDDGETWLINLGQTWRKPFFSLFIYHLFDRLKMALMLTKLLSCIAIRSIMFSFEDSGTNGRVAAFAVSGIVMAHAILIYQQHRFALVYLNVTRNLPYSLGRLYVRQMLTYSVLLLPECIWIIINFKFLMAIGLLGILLGIIMLFHSILYRIGLAMNKYLPWLLGVFFATSLIILFGLTWLLVPLCFGVSFLLFYFNYYNEELTE